MLQGSTRLSLHPSLPHRSTGRERAIETGGDGGVLSGERSARLSCHPDRLMFPFYGSLLCQPSLSLSLFQCVFLCFCFSTRICVSLSLFTYLVQTPSFYHFPLSPSFRPLVLSLLISVFTLFCPFSLPYLPPPISPYQGIF